MNVANAAFSFAVDQFCQRALKIRKAAQQNGAALFLLFSNVVDAYRRALAPHDLTMAGFANLRLEQKFFGTEKNVSGHELGTRIGHVEDLAAHRAMTVVKDDKGIL